MKAHIQGGIDVWFEYFIWTIYGWNIPLAPLDKYQYCDDISLVGDEIK